MFPPCCVARPRAAGTRSEVYPQFPRSGFGAELGAARRRFYGTKVSELL